MRKGSYQYFNDYVLFAFYLNCCICIKQKRLWPSKFVNIRRNFRKSAYLITFILIIIDVIIEIHLYI